MADVYKVLSSLDVNKANGPDAISPRILKECAAELAPSVSQLFNFSLVHGKLPSVWKSADVVSIHDPFISLVNALKIIDQFLLRVF